MSVTDATVRAYVSRILHKLGVRSRGEAIAIAFKSRFYTSHFENDEVLAHR
jgi:DNA-binding NarL/FixJ family response regulator